MTQKTQQLVNEADDKFDENGKLKLKQPTKAKIVQDIKETLKNTKLEKVVVDGAIVTVIPDKIYSNGKTGKQIIEENPKPKKSKSKETLQKKTTAAKKKVVSTEERQEQKRAYWRMYAKKNAEKYKTWSKRWRDRKKAERDAEKAKTEQKTTKKVATKNQ